MIEEEDKWSLCPVVVEVRDGEEASLLPGGGGLGWEKQVERKKDGWREEE